MGLGWHIAGFLLGTRETLLETKDGGRTWSQRSIEAAKDEGEASCFYEVSYPDALAPAHLAYQSEMILLTSMPCTCISNVQDSQIHLIVISCRLQLPIQLHLVQWKRGLDLRQASHPAAHNRLWRELGACPAFSKAPWKSYPCRSPPRRAGLRGDDHRPGANILSFILQTAVMQEVTQASCKLTCGGVCSG